MWVESGVPPNTTHPGSPPRSLSSEGDGSPAGRGLPPPAAQTHRGSRRRVPRDQRPTTAGPDPRPRPVPCALTATKPEGGGEEHADDHPLARSGRTCALRGLRAGGDAEAELGWEPPPPPPLPDTALASGSRQGPGPPGRPVCR